MNLKTIKLKTFGLIKIVSTVLITGAIGLEAWNRYATLTNFAVPNQLYPVFWIGRFALAAHAIEGIIAILYAGSKEKMPIRYGIYTFFVGTVGLIELFETEVNKELNKEAT